MREFSGHNPSIISCSQRTSFSDYTCPPNWLIAEVAISTGNALVGLAASTILALIREIYFYRPKHLLCQAAQRLAILLHLRGACVHRHYKIRPTAKRVPASQQGLVLFVVVDKPMQTSVPICDGLIIITIQEIIFSEFARLPDCSNSAGFACRNFYIHRVACTDLGCQTHKPNQNSKTAF